MNSREKGQRMIRRFFSQRVASDAAVARFGQYSCFACACLIPVLAFRRFSELELSEGQLLIGVIATMSLAVLCAVAGELLVLVSKTKAG